MLTVEKDASFWLLLTWILYIDAGRNALSHRCLAGMSKGREMAPQREVLAWDALSQESRF